MLELVEMRAPKSLAEGNTGNLDLDIIYPEVNESKEQFVDKIINRAKDLFFELGQTLERNKINLGRARVANNGFEQVLDYRYTDDIGPSCVLATLAVQVDDVVARRDNVERQGRTTWRYDNRLYRYLDNLNKATMWLHEVIYYTARNNQASDSDATRAILRHLLSKSFGFYPDPMGRVSDLMKIFVDLGFLSLTERSFIGNGKPYFDLHQMQERTLFQSSTLSIQTFKTMENIRARYESGDFILNQVIELSQEIKDSLPRWNRRREFCPDVSDLSSTWPNYEKLRYGDLISKYLKDGPNGDDESCLNSLSGSLGSVGRIPEGDRIARSIYDRWKNFESQAIDRFKQEMLDDVVNPFLVGLDHFPISEEDYPIILFRLRSGLESFVQSFKNTSILQNFYHFSNSFGYIGTDGLVYSRSGWYAPIYLNLQDEDYFDYILATWP